jgi:hypothetical protein
MRKNAGFGLLSSMMALVATGTVFALIGELQSQSIRSQAHTDTKLDFAAFNSALSSFLSSPLNCASILPNNTNLRIGDSILIPRIPESESYPALVEVGQSGLGQSHRFKISRVTLDSLSNQPDPNELSATLSIEGIKEAKSKQLGGNSLSTKHTLQISITRISGQMQFKGCKLANQQAAISAKNLCEALGPDWTWDESKAQCVPSATAAAATQANTQFSRLEVEYRAGEVGVEQIPTVTGQSFAFDLQSKQGRLIANTIAGAKVSDPERPSKEFCLPPGSYRVRSRLSLLNLWGRSALRLDVIDSVVKFNSTNDRPMQGTQALFGFSHVVNEKSDATTGYLELDESFSLPSIRPAKDCYRVKLRVVGVSFGSHTQTLFELQAGDPSLGRPLYPNERASDFPAPTIFKVEIEKVI